MPSILIVGMGAAGLLLLHMFQAEGVPAEEIVCIDPFFDGGDLQRQWRFVISNTPWQRVLDTLRVLNPSYVDKSGLEPTKTTNLYEAIRAIRDPVQDYLQKCTLVPGLASSVAYEASEKTWTVNVNAKTYEGKLLFLCQGSEPKTLSLPIPSLPLATALNITALSAVLSKKDRVLVFGTMHSGTLVLQNLQTLGCPTTAVYKGAKPFLFARDGEYDGIKEDAATIADAILNKQYKNVELVEAGDIAALARGVRTSNWVIYAVGFEQRAQMAAPFSLREYDGETGRLRAASCWGFGIAFPSMTRLPDGSVHKDVSLLSFATHISKQREDILREWRLLK